MLLSVFNLLWLRIDSMTEIKFVLLVFCSFALELKTHLYVMRIFQWLNIWLFSLNAHGLDVKNWVKLACNRMLSLCIYITNRSGVWRTLKNKIENFANNACLQPSESSWHMSGLVIMLDYIICNIHELMFLNILQFGLYNNMFLLLQCLRWMWVQQNCIVFLFVQFSMRLCCQHHVWTLKNSQ